VLRAAIAVVRTLVLEEWRTRRKHDTRPDDALHAVERWLAAPTSPEEIARCKETAKACTAARSETFGDQHRIAEAARAIAWAITPKNATNVFDAIALCEQELLARIALTSEFHLGPAQRRAIVDALRAELTAGQRTEAPSCSAGLRPPPAPAAYSIDGHFELGQTVTHKKFGSMHVTTVSDSWIEVTLEDGTTKRLAHKPAVSPA